MDQLPKFKPKGSNLESQEKFEIDFAEESIASFKHPDRNEDAVLADKQSRAFGVFDGMGGHEAGDVASRLAKDTILANLNRIKDGLSIKEAGEEMVALFANTHQTIVRESRGRDMGTTGVLLKFYIDDKNKKWALIANVGDSRVYKLAGGGKLNQVTEDDDALSADLSPEDPRRLKIARALAEAKSASDLTGQENVYFRMRNQITKALGRHDNPPTVMAVPVGTGDIFLVSSDGLHDNLTHSEIEEAFQEENSLEYIAQTLAQNAMNRSLESKDVSLRAKADDVSVIVVEAK